MLTSGTARLGAWAKRTGAITFAAAAASGVLLRLAFPPFSQGDLAFMALVPLLLALRRSAPRRGFRLGFVFGLVFRVTSLSWLAALGRNGGPPPLVVFGIVALSAWTALFHGLFGWLAASLWSFSRRESLPLPWLFAAGAWFSEPLVWAGCEHLVGVALTGFPWNPLAATQTRNLALLSVVSLAGAPLLSALLVSFNGGVASLLARLWGDVVAPRLAGSRPAAPSRVPRSLALAFSAAMLIAAWWRGIDRVRALDRASIAAPRFRMALVHPGAPCIFERDDAAVAAANDALRDLTELASATGPDLVVWPETSLPGYFPYDREAAALVRDACEASGAPLVAGTVEYRPRFPGDTEGPIYNSAILFHRPCAVVATYRKRHLVPFGEFIPLESKVPPLKRLAPAGFSCEPGHEAVLFHVENKSAATNRVTAALAPLICFEDVFPYLARDCAAAGAGALLSIANDAWFDGTSEPEQHLSQAVLRAAETGLPVIRATNRGVTAVILPSGRVVRRIGGGFGGGEPGFLTAEVGVEVNPAMTPYVRHGEALFALPCAGYAIGLAIAAAFIRLSLARRRQLAPPAALV